MTVPQCSKGARAALYLRVSKAREAEHDVSIPDQKRQGEAYCSARGYAIVETYVEPEPPRPTTAALSFSA
ncbi:recombinase family protein [Bradyrhizobium sp. sGM-13]|uniref:recombinase family protein n=1 Tax=unclassified Bradyrhizobium TaxID=2631580 RepID=UPI0035C7A99A